MLFWPSLKAHNHVPHDVHWCVFSPLTAVKPRWKVYLWRRHTLDVSRWQNSMGFRISMSPPPDGVFVSTPRIVGWTERTYRLYGLTHCGLITSCGVVLIWSSDGTKPLSESNYYNFREKKITFENFVVCKMTAIFSCVSADMNSTQCCGKPFIHRIYTTFYSYNIDYPYQQLFRYEYNMFDHISAAVDSVRYIYICGLSYIKQCPLINNA